MMLLTNGCATQPAPEPQQAFDGYREISYSGETSSCLALFDGLALRGREELDANNIGIVNWNIQKGSDADWADDLAALLASPDLLILQEASPRFAAWDALVPGHFRSFAAGFGKDRKVTGVMTLSRAAPVRECDLVAREPWFGTRKATLITEYELTGTDQTLLVANIHGINFTFGVHDLYWQLRQTEAVIALHDGPVVFSGDFNTWRGKRARVLDDVVSSLGLTALEFDADHRKRVLGQPLDHIYVRDMHALDATTRDLESSDHNPMMVRLRYVEPELVAKVAQE
ncbi:MAG: endonuclease/exonuclease/phosphatase family protein [Woeseiaceae bacterium]|nr:endonuclease/exonuclease/phosphatase family protein [Woeseiaceae bacterium]